MDQRIGKFTLSRDVVFGDQAQDIFRQLNFVPLRCESMYNGYFEYVGISPMFAEVEEGFVAQEYKIIIDTVDEDITTVSVEAI